MARRLLTERGMVFRQYGPPKVLTERAHTDGSPIVEITGVFQNHIDINSNGRRYQRKIWERVLAPTSDFMQKVKRRGVLGVLEHPGDGNTKISEASHVITNVRFATDREISESKGILRPGDILGSYEILGTHSGKDLQALHEARIEVGVSSRGNGSTIQCQGYEDVEDDYDVDTWDVVYNPSVTRATPAPAPVTESTDKPLSEIPAKLEESASNPTGKETKPQPQTHTMSKLIEFKNLKARALQLVKTNTKGMKPSELNVLIESAEQTKLDGQLLAGEDPSLTEASRDLSTRINKFLTEMDEEFDAPAPPAPGADNGGDGDGDGDGDADDIDDVASEAIGDTIAFLRDKLEDDPEALELADRLEDVTVAHEPDLEGEISDSEIKNLPESVRTKVRGLRTRHALALKQHERLTATTATLLERYRTLRKAPAPLAESGQLTKLTLKYNTDTLTLAHKLTEAKLPELYVANKLKLDECKTLVEFEDIVEAALKARPRKPVTEGTKPVPPTKPLVEGTKPAPTPPAPPTKPLAEGTKPAPKPSLTEAHEAVRMVCHARR